jgi:hypothetical protein
MLVPNTSARGSSSSEDTIISTLTSCGMVTGAPCSITIRRGSCGTAAMAKPVSSASASWQSPKTRSGERPPRTSRSASSAPTPMPSR